MWCLIVVRLKDDKSTKFHQVTEPGDNIRSNEPPGNEKTTLIKYEYCML